MFAVGALSLHLSSSSNCWRIALSQENTAFCIHPSQIMVSFLRAWPSLRIFFSSSDATHSQIFSEGGGFSDLVARRKLICFLLLLTVLEERFVLWPI